jgi:hypothetical protein
LKNFSLGKAIEGDIQLYCVEVFRIKLKPLFLWNIGRIEGPVPPMRVVIAACPNEDHL